ncbi:nucleotide sugar dehydrogenase, partial [Candidatus Pelagibacter sp.]|nr:nucleotide sugar dehydrogenase [Candidatus Pelagibacter sp.]
MSNFKKKKLKIINAKIAVIGLGYVGLPLIIQLAKKKPVIGYDIKNSRINELKNGIDSTLEVSSKELKFASNLFFTNNIKDIKKCKTYIITVPTPIDKHNKPDLSYLKKASELVGSILEKDNIVIYESTVYPGATEEFCVPLLEKKSSLIFNKDFYCGYSPERINPGDKKHRLTNIKKITSGSNLQTAIKVNKLYKGIIKAGTYMAPSIKVAEAAKVIENTQRDINIALINELAIIFNKLNIDTNSVLEAARTKWNFLSFTPGLVGGHCIGVDPYYLASKAQEVGYRPEIILAGRKLNNNMGFYVRDEVVKLMKKKKINISNSNVLIMGITFKENCPDIRNSRVVDIVDGFKKLNMNVDVYDPWVNKDNLRNELGIEIINEPKKNNYDVLVLAVAHNEFKSLSFDDIKSFVKR